MATSQNGWPASPNLPLRKLIVAGESFAPGILDNDDVFTVLQYVAVQVNKRVERIYMPGWHEADDWGFYFRANANNPNSLSNHSSATAIDYNATRHPNGVPTRNTFTGVQIAEIHDILDEVGNVVRWGGDYRGTPDAMHFEINASPTLVKHAADKVRAMNVNYRPLGAADVVYQNVKVGRNGTIDDLLDAAMSSEPTVGAFLECGGNWRGIKAWAASNGYSIFTGRTGDPISTNGCFLVKHRSGYEDFGYATIATPWKGPKHTRKNPKIINGRTAYWLNIPLGGEPYRLLLTHYQWGYGKYPSNTLAYSQYAQLERRWGQMSKTTRNLLRLSDANLGAGSKVPFSPRGTNNVLGASFIGVSGVDQASHRAMPGSSLRVPRVVVGKDNYDSPGHFPLAVKI